MEYIDNIFHFYETLESYNEHKRNNLISPDSIVFVEEEHRVYTQGTWFGISKEEFDELKELVEKNAFTDELKSKLDSIEPGAQVNTVNSVAGKQGNIILNKEDVGLENVDNTKDIDKPLSTAQRAAFRDIRAQLESHINSHANPHKVTKVQVGLENVDNTSDLNKPISRATQAALDKKADTRDIPTKVSQLTNDSKFQNETQVNAAIQKVVGAAPEALDTLEEIAAKLSDNDDIHAAIINTISEKASKTALEEVSTNLDNEIGRATNADADLNNKIDTVISTQGSINQELTSSISEKLSREDVPNAVTYNITITGDSTWSGNLPKNFAEIKAGNIINIGYGDTFSLSGVVISSETAGSAVEIYSWVEDRLELISIKDDGSFTVHGLPSMGYIKGVIPNSIVCNIQLNNGVYVDDPHSSILNANIGSVVRITGIHHNGEDGIVISKNNYSIVILTAPIITSNSYTAGSVIYVSRNTSDWHELVIPSSISVASKVSKVPGKDLSTNDFTNEYKLKLDNLKPIRKLSTEEINNLASKNEGDLIYNTTINKYVYWDGTSWKEVGDADLSNYVTRSELDNEINAIDALIDTKVDKISGKGLSTNDFTNEYKDILDNPWAETIE